MLYKNRELIDINLVEDIVFTHTGSAHLKDLKSGKYLISNLANARKVGLSKPDEVIGLTVWDLDQHMKQNWGKLATEIEGFDRQIQYKQEHIIAKNRVFLTPFGDIFVHHMKKYPIITSNGSTCSVLTLNDNITKDIHLIQLWKIFKNLYKVHNRPGPISGFLHYLKINSYFYEPPTEAELITLITKKTKPAIKDIAHHLCVSPKTVETHIYRLRSKLSIDLSYILGVI